MGALEDAQAEIERRSRVMAGDHSDDDPKTAKAAATPKGGGSGSRTG